MEIFLVHNQRPNTEGLINQKEFIANNLEVIDVNEFLQNANMADLFNGKIAVHYVYDLILKSLSSLNSLKKNINSKIINIKTEPEPDPIYSKYFMKIYELENNVYIWIPIINQQLPE